METTSTSASPRVNSRGNALISFLVLALGVAFVALYQRSTMQHAILVLGGLAFVIPAVIALLAVFTRREVQHVSGLMRVVQIVCGVGGLGLGICILVIPDTFRPLLVYLFAALLVLGGIYQVSTLARRDRQAQYPGWLLIAPGIDVIGGVLMFALPALHGAAHEPIVMLLTGIGFILFGLTGLLTSGYNFSARRARSRQAAAAAPQVAEATPSAAAPVSEPSQPSAPNPGS